VDDNVLSIDPLSPIEYFLFCALLKESQITYATKNFVDTAVGSKFTNTEAP
jgi:hypothetical protein